MDVIDNLNTVPLSDKRLVVALGNFDGVHLGHRQIINEMVKYAQWTRTIPAVFLFHPHPLRVLNPETSPKMINDLPQKLRLMEQLGVKVAFVVPFGREIAERTPQQFVEDILVKKLHVAGVFVGFNYRFGNNASGRSEMMSEFGMKYGFMVNVMPPYIINSMIVSSTQVRMCLENGDILKAQQMLGYWPLLKGQIISGDQRGRTLGFPTANIKVPEEMTVPGPGVYAAQAHIAEASYSAVLNIGFRPTFYKYQERSIEAHLLKYQGTAYGKIIEIDLYERLRDEKKFELVHDLIQQIKKDIQAASVVCARNGVPSAY
jgi:riboflavin kinase/FMN adenylyltransferase